MILGRLKVDSSDAENIDFQCSGSSSGGERFISESDEEEIILDKNFVPLVRKPRRGDYVITSLQSKKSNGHYVVKVLEELKDDDTDYFVSYMKLKNSQ